MAKSSGSGLSDSEYLAFLDNALGSIDMKVIMSNLSLFAYDGFNPKKFKILLATEIYISSGKDKGKAKATVMQLIAWILERGAKPRKKGGDFKMEKSGAEIARELVSALKIKNYTQGDAGGAKGAKDVTLARIGIVLVKEMALVVATNPQIAKVQVSGMPRFMSINNTAQLLPTDVRDVTLTAAWNGIVEWNIEFTKLINSTQTQEDVEKFMHLAYAGGLYTNDERIEAILNCCSVALKSKSETKDTLKAFFEGFDSIIAGLDSM